MITSWLMINGSYAATVAISTSRFNTYMLSESTVCNCVFELRTTEFAMVNDLWNASSDHKSTVLACLMMEIAIPYVSQAFLTINNCCLLIKYFKF